MAHSERREELAGFLRTRRARLAPADVGFSGGPRRRTPGLRREEVAQLAGVSVTWYTQLEQGQPIHASAQVLASIARALQLTPGEREHLFRLAQQPLPRPAPPAAETVSPALQQVLDLLDVCPAYLIGQRFDLLAWNRAACAVYGDFQTIPVRERNLVWWVCTSPALRRLVVDWEGYTRRVLARFRVRYGLHVGDAWFTELIDRLQQTSPEFRAWWPRHDILERSGWRQELRHPVVGPLALERIGFDVIDAPGLRLLVQVPLRETDTATKIRQLLGPARTAGTTQPVPTANLLPGQTNAAPP